jgi:DNA repair protein RecO (recombination protein O)
VAGLYRDRGIVLRSIKLGEADRIVTFLTEGRGKVRAVAKGVRKPKSRFGARLEPTTHLNLQLYEGRNLDVVTQVETIDANRKLRETYGAFTQAIAMLEAVDHVAQEAEANVPLYRMLAAALRALAEDPVPAVSAAFFWKLLALEGVSPVLDACVRCDETVVDVAATFDVAEGGVLCRACAGPLHCSGEAGEPPKVSVAGLALVGRILGGGLRGVLAEPPGPALAEAESLALRALEHHLERRLRSTPMLLATIPGYAPRS